MFAHIGLVEELFKAHAEYTSDLSPDFFRAFLKKQEPYITLITCSDSRVQTEVLGIEPVNNVFVIRNIGNQLLSNLGSVDYGIYHLKTPLLIIMGHVRCGAIHAALHDYSKETVTTIQELNNLCPPLKKVQQKRFKRFNEMWEEAVIENLNFQVELALNRYGELVKSGKLTVLGLIYDFANLYGKGKGKLLLANVNGATTPEGVLNLLSEEEREKYKTFVEENFITRHWFEEE
jgi:carbonic anhydrase